MLTRPGRCFIDEIGATTKIGRLKRAVSTARVIDPATSRTALETFVAGLRNDGFVLDGPMGGSTFVSHIEQYLVTAHCRPRCARPLHAVMPAREFSMPLSGIIHRPMTAGQPPAAQTDPAGRSRKRIEESWGQTIRWPCAAMLGSAKKTRLQVHPDGGRLQFAPSAEAP
jgi:hypothetical protein